MSWTNPDGQFGSSSILSVSYGDGLFFMAGLDGKLSTSPDGAVWTARTSNFNGSGVIDETAYGAGVYVAGGSPQSFDDQIITSSSGTSWSMPSSGLGNYGITALCFGNSLFAAFADAGTDNYYVYTSSNGASWTNVAGPFAELSGSIKRVKYLNGLYVATGSNKVYTSTDATTWTPRTVGSSVQMNDVAFGAGLYVAVGGSGKLYTSPDCITWTSRTSGFGTSTIYGVTFDGTTFYACGASQKIYSSTDGITWSAVTTGFSGSASLFAITYGGGTIVIAGASNTVLVLAAALPSHGSGSVNFFGVATGDGYEDQFSIGVFESGAATCTDALLITFYAAVREALVADDVDTAIAAYKLSMTEAALAQVFSADGKLFTAIITEAVNGSAGTAILLGMQAIERAVAIDPSISLRNVSLSVAEAIIALVSLGQGTSYAVLESAAANDQAAAAAGLLALLIESAVAVETAVATLRLNVILEESAIASDAPTTLAQYIALLTESGSASVVLRIGDEEWLGWVMNPQGATTKDGTLPAVSQYQNFPFNSLARIGYRYYAAGQEGLYELTGTDDDGASIAGYLKSGKLDFGSSVQKRLDSAYFAVATNGTVRLKVITNDGGGNAETWYELTSRDEGEVAENLRLKLGKGLRSRYWQFELVVQDASAFELEEMTFVPMNLTRRL